MGKGKVFILLVFAGMVLLVPLARASGPSAVTEEKASDINLIRRRALHDEILNTTDQKKKSELKDKLRLLELQVEEKGFKEYPLADPLPIPLRDPARLPKKNTR